MPPRDHRARIKDILEAIQRALRYTDGLTFQQFCADEKTIDAVVRNLTVIGEASRHVPEHVRSRGLNVPWREMSDIRNIVVHEYFGVSLEILWQTIRGDLPTLVDPLSDLLAQLTDQTD